MVDGSSRSAARSASERNEPSRLVRRGRRSITALLSGVGAALTIVALYIWDDVLLAAPIVTMTAFIGPIAAFALCGSVYATVSFVLALAGVRAYDRWTKGSPSKLAEWLDRQRAARRAGLGTRLLASGKIVGFVASSFLLGGIVTTFLIRYGGRRDGIERIALLSSLVFAVSFTAVYTGIAQAVFAL